MSYEKQTWETGDIVTSAKLNHLEDGIANGTYIVYPVYNENYTEATLRDADNNTVSYNMIKDQYNTILVNIDESGGPSNLSTGISFLAEFQYSHNKYSAYFTGGTSSPMSFSAQDADAALTWVDNQ